MQPQTSTPNLITQIQDSTQDYIVEIWANGQQKKKKKEEENSSEDFHRSGADLSFYERKEMK